MNAKTEDWEKAGDYAMRKGQLTISKAKVMDTLRFPLWLRDECIGIYNTAAEAALEAEMIRQHREAT